MRLQFPKVPPLMVIGFIEERDFTVLSLDNNEVVFESDELVEEAAPLILAIYDLAKNQYNKFYFYKYEIIELQAQEFSYIYRVKIFGEEDEKFVQQVEIIKQLANIPKNTPPNELQKKFSSLSFFEGTHTLYPHEQDEIFHSTCEEQWKEWFKINVSEEENIQYAKVAEKVEIAFSLNHFRTYAQVLKQGITKTISLALSDLNLREHGMFCKGFSRVYIGNEFCPHLCPKKDMLMELLQIANEEGYKVTVVLPYITEDKLEETKKLLSQLNHWCYEKSCTLEVTINDWAILQFLNEGLLNLQPILGRLMNKRKKDPRITMMFGYERYKEKMEENNLNSPYYVSFLQAHHLFRFEFEDYVLKNKIPCGKHSIHFPFYQINTSAFCPLYAENTFYTKYKQNSVKECPHYCDEFCFIYPSHLNMIGKGSSIFGFSKELIENIDYMKEYVERGIDRFVFSAE